MNTTTVIKMVADADQSLARVIQTALEATSNSTIQSLHLRQLDSKAENSTVSFEVTYDL